jgi:hypothetical protein
VVCLAFFLGLRIMILTNAITLTARRYDPGTAPSCSSDGSFRNIFFPFLVSLPSRLNKADLTFSTGNVYTEGGHLVIEVTKETNETSHGFGCSSSTAFSSLSSFPY